MSLALILRSSPEVSLPAQLLLSVLIDLPVELPYLIPGNQSGTRARAPKVFLNHLADLVLRGIRGDEGDQSVIERRKLLQWDGTDQAHVLVDDVL